MLKNIYLWIVIVITCSSLGFSQEVEIPEIITPTPEAASLGKYGNTPVSKYTGVPNISIPLYTITEGDITVPITLNYHAGGFRVQEEATWVGLGWSLSAGGSISKDARGKVDDNDSNFNVWGNNNILPENYLSYSQGFYDIFGIDKFLIDNTSYYLKDYFDDLLQVNPTTGWTVYTDNDFQADHFRYNFPGKSGEFYNQNNTNYIDLSNNLLKIENGTSLDKGFFKITDENGFVFHFGDRNFSPSGGVSAMEASYTTTIINGASPNSGGDKTTNYHLTNITSSKGNIVNFQYGNTNTNDNILSGVSIFHRGYYTDPSGSDLSNNPTNQTIIETQTSTRVSVLSRIEFTHGFVQFNVNDNSDPRLDLVGNGAKKLNSIEVYKYVASGTPELIKKIEFEYSYFNATSAGLEFNSSLTNSEANSKRLKLDRIKEYGANDNIPPKVHEFIYNSTALPKKTSFSVDRYGYYNGVQNSTYLPRIIIGGTGTLQGADVEVNSSFSNASLLEEIIYPTKGSTSFIYESNDFTGSPVTEYVPFYASAIFVSESSVNDTSNAEKTFTIDYSQPISFDIHFVVHNTSTNPNDLYIEIVKDNLQYGLWDLYSEPNLNTCINNECNFDFTTVINLDPGTYTVKIHNNTITNNSGTAKSIASISTTYTTQGTTTHMGPGVRIKEIINKDYNSNIVGRKQYEYLHLNQTSSGYLLYNPRFLFRGYLPTSNGDAFQTFNFRANTPIQPFSSSANGKMLGYARVIEYSLNSSDIPNGKLVSVFNVFGDIPTGDGADHEIQNFPYVSSPLNGMPKNEEAYKFVNGNFQISTRKVFDYKILSSSIRWYGAVREILIGNPYLDDYAYFPLCLYPEISTFVGLDSSIEEIYDAKDETKSVAITKNYEYENTQLVQEITTTSNGEAKKINYYYPLTPNRPVGVVPQEMIDKNILSPVVASTLEIDGTSISTTATDYKIWYGATTTTTNEDNIILPEKIKSLKGVYSAASELEDKIIYHSYDDNGNPLEVSRANGMIVSYIWGHSGKYPIAKIENLNYDSIEGLSEFGDDFSIDTELNASQEAALRGIATAMVTTYKYNPLIGVTSITDPRGNSIYYEYDEFNRLKEVKDKDGNLVSDYQYSYKIPVQN